MKAYDIIEVFKAVYIELAKEQIESESRDVSLSRLSVVTGIDRRDIKRIYQEKKSSKKPESIVTQVLARWQQDKRFLTSSGKPRVLEVEGKESEFCELVRVVSTDMSPYTVLYELERTGALKRTANGVRMVSGAYIVRGNLKDAVSMLATDAGDLIAAIEENTVMPAEALPNYHLTTECDNVPIEAIPKIKKWLLEQGTRYHQRVRRYISQYDKDLNPAMKGKPGSVRVVFGGFSRTEMLEPAGAG